MISHQLEVPSLTVFAHTSPYKQQLLRNGLGLWLGYNYIVLYMNTKLSAYMNCRITEQSAFISYNSYINYLFQGKAKVCDVFNQVCEHLSLRESEYFGLAQLVGEYIKQPAVCVLVEGILGGVCWP